MSAEQEKLRKLKEYAQGKPVVTLKLLEHTPTLDFFSALGSGIVAKAVMFPFENIQSYLALRKDYKSFKRRDAYYAGIPEMIKQEGVKSLFKGIAPISLKQGLHYAVDFALFYQIKYSMFPREHIIKTDIGLKGNLMSGILASLIGYFALNPILEAGITQKGTNQIAAILDAIKKDGIMSMYRHWRFDLPIALLSRGIMIGMFEAKFKRAYYHMNGKVPAPMKFLDAYAIALFTGFLAFPFEHAKRRVLRALEEDPQGIHNIGMLFKLEGSIVFLQGISRLFLMQISTALTFLSFYTLMEHRNIQEVPI